MAITIREVTGKRDFARFVDFHNSQYKGNPYWVPPLRKDEFDAFHPRRNPALEFYHQFLRLQRNSIVPATNIDVRSQLFATCARK